MFDIDYFKQYNDLYGHIPRDLVARFGGEEFVVLLPNADASVALKVADRCQRLIQKKAIVHEKSPFDQKLTVSIGVGTIVPGEGMESSAFIETVDQQLYAAKRNGRNRVECVPVVG